MAIPGNVQTLLAAFSFGILLEAASSATYIFYKGRGSKILQDGRRLVLVLFSLFATLWAQIVFISLLLPRTSTATCQGLLLITTAFDQLARVLLEQFLLWAIGHGTKVTTERLVLQGILAVRLVAGGVHVGFSRTEFAPTCIARSEILPVPIAALALDVIIIGVLIFRAFSLGMFGDLRDQKSSDKQDRSRALILSIAGLAIWTGTSVAMLLGIPRTLLLIRTLLPALGLLVLVGILMLFSGALLSESEKITTPEAQSPFMSPPTRSRDLFHASNMSESPRSGNLPANNGRLFVVNPSSTPGNSPLPYNQGTRQINARGFPQSEYKTAERFVDGEGQGSQASKSGPGYRGSSGVFGNTLGAPVVGAGQGFAPQSGPSITAKPNQLDVTPSSPQVIAQKKSRFNWTKEPAKPTVRKLGISNPVAMDNEDPAGKPPTRMPTIDLATAAANERERREGAAAAPRPRPQRPARPSQALNAQEGLRKSIRTKRKEMPSQATTPAQASTASTLMIDKSNAASTSSSLSPSREEVRRRSPRNNNSFDNVMGDKPYAVPGVQNKGRSAGLSSNPMPSTAVDTQYQNQEQTVMFMGDIEYADPGAVQNIIRNAPVAYQSGEEGEMPAPSAPWTNANPKSAGSIIDRPRPYRKESENDRALFPSEASPHHRRSKSGSSILDRKSMFKSNPGNPSLLPPLPRPPKSAKELKRILPNDTKSMTFDEKIELLFPAPPSRAASNRHRRSSVPSIPQLPAEFLAESPTRDETEGSQQGSDRASKRSTIASFAIFDALLSDKVYDHESSKSEKHQTQWFSASTYRSIGENAGEKVIPALSRKDTKPQVLTSTASKRQSIRPMRSSFSTDTTKVGSVSDDATTYSGSVHSNDPPVDLRAARQNARSLILKGNNTQENGEDIPPVPRIPSSALTNDTEEIPLMLDTAGLEQQIPIFLSNDNRDSFLLDDGETLPGSPSSQFKEVPAWHRRVGDRLLAFSERQSKARSRKMPPPTPLLLNKSGRIVKVAYKAEPSPVTPPERAIAELQAQLHRFEEVERDSFGATLHPAPAPVTDNAHSPGIEEQLRLLKNLEMEMGEQENQWQQMQNSLDRNSLATTVSSIPTPLPPTPPAKDGMSRETSQRDARRMSRRLSRRGRIGSDFTVQTQDGESVSTESTQSSDNSRASIWQQRLADAQMDYMENAPALLGKNMNFLSMSNAQLGSPTPPDSEGSATDIDSDMDSDVETGPSQFMHRGIQSLWCAPPSSPMAARGRLWTPPYEASASRSLSPEPPAQSLRPSNSRGSKALDITSFALWSKSDSSERTRPGIGLWRSKNLRPRSIATRRASIKPPRKQKRMTYLPDIVESPVPVPNKRDTLGIFQFPWGETSDQPVFQAPFNPNTISRSTADKSGRTKTRQSELSSLPEGYSSSFFDDYDDEDDEFADFDYDSQDFDSEDSDDEFDEGMLSDIADLLKSRDVPSRHSLMPVHKQMIEDHDNEASITESESENFKRVVMAPIKLPIMPLTMNPKSQQQLMNSTVEEASFMASSGLPQPEPAHRELPAAPSVLRAEIPQQLTSRAFELAVGGLSTGMWTKPATVSHDAKVSAEPLFCLSQSKTEAKSTNALPAALGMIRKPRVIQLPLSLLKSNALWSQPVSLTSGHHWISEASVRPLSPSVYSPTSDGSSTPSTTPGYVSDSASVKSASTNSSSLWGSFSSSVSSAGTVPEALEAAASKIPHLRRPNKEPLATVRESRVLASPDVWEATAPADNVDAHAPTPSNPLRKPIAAGNSASENMTPRLHRINASPAMWEAALLDAIRKSEPSATDASFTSSQSLTWTPPSVAVESKESYDANSMWQSTTESNSEPETLFSNPHTQPWYRSKRDDSEMEIESSRLWKESSEIPSSPKNWLIRRKTKRVQFRY